MLDPRNVWIGMALCVALYFVYATMQPSEPANSERLAYLRTTVGSETKVTKLNRSECLAMKQRLWVETEKETACIAYITPVHQPAGKTALLYFHGDFRRENQTAAKMERSRKSYVIRTARIARTYNVPVYAVARTGVMGSTGFHMIGGVRSDYGVMVQAVSELKRRYGIDKLVLAGQSGGARLTAQMLASGRSDIACAAMASGAYGIPGAKGGGRMPTNIWGEPSRSYLIPLRNVGNVVTDGARRLFVVGDVRDKRTPFDEQREWAEALKRAGHHVVLLQATGGGKEFHYLSRAGMQIAGMCASGKSDREIADAVRRLSSRADKAEAGRQN